MPTPPSYVAPAPARVPASWRKLVGDIPAALVGSPRDRRPFVVTWSGCRRVLLERMVYEHRRGRRPGVDPTQGSIDLALDRADRIRIIRGGLLGDQALGVRVLLDSRLAREREALRPGLRIVEDPATFHFAGGLGHLTIELYRDDSRLLALTFPDGSSLRTTQWRHDARLADPRTLLDGLDALGILPAALEPDPDDPRQFDLLALGPIERSCRRAETALRRGYKDRALVEIEAGLRLAPDSSALRLERAKVWLAHGRGEEARDEVKALIDRDGPRPENLGVMALMLRGAGAVGQAVDLAWKVVRVDWTRPESHSILAEILASVGRHQEAVESLTMMLRLRPFDTYARLRRVQGHLACDQADEALEEIEALILNHPDFREKPPLLSRPHRELVPDRSVILLLKARALMMKGDVAGFRAAIAEARAADPANLLPLIDLIGFHSDRDEFDEALAVCDELIDLCPDGPAYLTRAQVSFACGNTDAAADDARHAAHLMPENAEIHGWCGGMLMNAGRFEDARQEFDLLLDKAPSQPAALLMRSCCWRELGIRAGQLADLERLGEEHPDDVAGLNSLSWLLATCADPEVRDGPRAVALARRAAEKTRFLDPNILDTLAAALAEDGRFDEAVETERRAIALFKKLPFAVDLATYRDRLATYARGEPLVFED
jgi:tetratricopeptide (TPR) repeat protein